MGHADRLANRMGGRSVAIDKQDTRSLDPIRRFCTRPRNLLQPRQVVFFNRDIDLVSQCCHVAQLSC